MPYNTTLPLTVFIQRNFLADFLQATFFSCYINNLSFVIVDLVGVELNTRIQSAYSVNETKQVIPGNASAAVTSSTIVMRS